MDIHTVSNRIEGLLWSSEPPKTPGWYWFKDHHGRIGVEQIHAHLRGSDTMTILENSFMGWRHIAVKNMERQWAGPIPEPK